MIKEYFEKLKFLFLNPTAFFESVQKENTYFPILMFFVIIYIISQIIGLIFSISIFSQTQLGVSAVWLSLGLFVFGIISAFIAPFIYSAIIHLGVLILKGKNGFFNTFKPITYTMTIGAIYSIVFSIIGVIFNLINPANTTQSYFINIPILIISFIIAVVAFIHIIYAGVTGLAKYQNMSKKRAFLAIILIPLIISIFFTILLGISFYKIVTMIS